MFQKGAVLNTQSFGNRPETLEVPFITNRQPLPTDINYPVGKRWVYEGDSEYVLLNLTTTSGNVVANWQNLSSTAANVTFIGDDGLDVVADINGDIFLTTSVVANSTNPTPLWTSEDGPNTENISIQVSTATASSDINSSGIASFDNSQFAVDSNGFVSITTDTLLTITGDSGAALAPTSDNWFIIGQKNGIIPVVQTNGAASTLSIEDRTSTTAFVVDPSSTPGQRGTYSTIQSAVTAATSGSTVFIKSGTYTENVTLKPGVNLAAYVNSSMTPTVTIIGKLSHTATGVVTISGIKLQTNGDYAISMTGSSASTSLFLIECNLVAEDFAALQMTTSGDGSSIRIINSWCRTNAVATNFFVVTGVGGLTFWNVNVLDGGATAQNTPSTFASTGQLLVKYSIIRFPITTSGTGRISGTDSEFNTFATNSTPLVVNATSSATLGNYVRGCIFLAGNTAALTIGAGATVNMLDCTIITTSTTPISGTGTLNQSCTSFSTTNALLSSTGLTVARKAFDAGALWGNWSGVAPAAGFVGQSISSVVAPNGITITSGGDGTNITSIILTPGTWDVNAIGMFTGITTMTRQTVSISTTSAFIDVTTYGNSTISGTFTTTTAEDVGFSIPSYRQLVPKGTTVTLYLVTRASFSASVDPKSYGRISATRVC